MEAEKVQKILSEVLEIGLEFGGPVPDAEDMPFATILKKAEAAAQIAEVAEADKADALLAQDAAWKEIEAELLVQIEEMRGALEWLVNLLHGQSKGGDATSPPSDDEWKAAIDAGVKALAPVPKRVLCTLEGITQHSYLYDDESCPATLVTMPEGEFVMAHNHEGRDGQSGIVVFLTEPEQGGEG